MSSAEHLSELESLRLQVAELSRALAERDQSVRVPNHHLEETMQDLREQSHLLRTIIEGTAAETGDEFFTSLVTHLTSTLHVQYALIGEVCEGRFKKIRTLAVSAGGTLVDNFEYELAHTPCATALTQAFTCFDGDVQRAFPQFQRLADLGAESYCAVPLRTKGGAVIGLLIVMDTKPLQHGDYLQSLLGILTPRVVVEFERRRAEQERAQALTDMQNIIDTVPDILFTLDTQGNMVKWNRRVAEVTGYSPEELWNKPALAFVPPEEQTRTAAAIQRAFTEGYAELDGLLLTKDLRTIPYHWTGALLKNAQGESIGITGVGRDVSDKKRAEVALRESEERLALAVEGSTDILWDAHRLPGEPWYAPQTPIWWSPRVRKLLGLQESDSFETLEQWAARLHPDDKDRVFGQLAAHIEHRVPYDVEYRLRTNAGDYCWIRGRGQALWDEQGEPRRMSGSCQDITERKRVEKALCESEERYRTVVDLSPNGVLVYSTGKKVYVNQAACAILGTASSEQLLENPTFHFYYPDVCKPIHASIEQILATGEPVRRVEWKCQRLDGSVISVEVDAGLIMWNGEPAVQVIFADITDHKRTEEALRASEERFHAAFRDATVGMGLIDLTNRIVEANQAFSEITGYSEAELKNLTFLDITHPDDRPANHALQQNAVKGKRESFEVEKRYIRKNGEIVWVHVSVGAIHDALGHVTHTIGLITDITERKRSEEALRESEAQFRALAESTTDWMWEIDEQGRYTYCSPKIFDLLGYEPAEALGKTPFDFMPEEEARRVAGLFGSIAAARRPFAGIENTNRRKDGRLVILECRGTPIIDDNGVFGGYRGFDQDITDRKQAEEKLRLSEQRQELALSGANLGLWDWDVSSGKTVFDARWCSMIGYAVDELEPHVNTWRSLLHPEDVPTIQVILESHLKNETPDYEVEFRIRHKAGHWIWILARGRVVERDYAGAPLRMAGTHMDITDRKRTEDAIREAELRYRTIFKQAGAGVAQIESRTGRFVQVNRQYCEIVGLTEAEMLATTFGAITHPDDLERNFESGRRLLSGEISSFTMEKRYVRKDGSIVWVNMNVAPLWRPGEIPVHHIAIVQDITERKRAEDALRGSEERLRLSLDAANQGIYDLNVQTGEAHVSPGYATMLGYDPATFCETNAAWIERLHPDDRVRVADYYRAYVAGKIAEYRIEFRQRTRGEDWRWILSLGRIVERDARGEPLRMLGTHTDITDRKQAEEALCRSERQLRTVLDALPVGIWFTDQSGKPVLSNPAAKEIWAGIKQIRIETAPNTAGWWETIGPSGELHRWALSRALTKGVSSLNETFDLECLDGTKKTIRNTSVPVQDETGVVLGAIVLNEDITALRQAQEALKLTQFSVDHAVEGFFWIGHDARILNVNNAACRMLEYTRDELTTMTMHDIDPNLPSDLWSAYWKGLKQKGSMTFESKLWSKTGRVLDTEVTINYLCYEGKEYNCVIMRDIGDRKRTEASLRQSEERYRSLVDNAPIGIFVNEGGRFAYVNQEMQRILKARNVYQLIGTPVLDRIAPEFHTVVKGRIHELMGNGQPVPSLDEQYVRLDGSRVDVAVTAIPTHFDGTPVMQVLVLDIAERKRMEEALHQRERDLRAAVEERERISQDLHDGILQSLFAMGLTLETAKSMMSPRNRQTLSPSIDQVIDQLNRVMHEIRNFIAGLGSDLLKGKDLPTALQHMLKTLTQHHAMRVRLAIDERAVQALSAEQSLHMALVIQEAVSNCIRHGRAQEATVSLKMLKQSLRLSIRDNGSGFNTETAKGIGHGLNNMAARAQKIGGRFTVFSRINKGTRVVFDLPKEVSSARR